MAYVTQYDLDMQKQKRMDQGLGMVLQGMQGMEENRRRALETKRAQGEQALKFAELGINPSEDELKELNETGSSKTLFDKYAEKANQAKQRQLEIQGYDLTKKKYDADQLSKPVQERDDYIKSIDSAKARSEITTNVMADKMATQERMRMDAEQRKLDNEKKQGIQKAAIPEFDVANPDVIPSSQDAEAVKKLNASNKTFQDVGNRTLKKLESISDRDDIISLDRIGFNNNWKDIQKDITEMRLQAKELANLGVLNGPDLKLVDETLGGISPQDVNMYGKKAVASRLKEAIETANSKLMNAAAARGYKPKSQGIDLSKMSREEKLRILNGQ